MDWLSGSLGLHISTCCRGSLACMEVDASEPLLMVQLLARMAVELLGRPVELMVVPGLRLVH